LREPPERFLAFKEIVIDNGLSNTRSALRTALAVAHLMNRTLILPQFWSRHLHGEPYRVGLDYYFDATLLQRHFPMVREASFLAREFPLAAQWPPHATIPIFFIQLSPGEQLCAETSDPLLMESQGKVNTTCPQLLLPAGQLRTIVAKYYHLGASEAQLIEWVAPFQQQRLLYFGRMFRRFSRFSSPAQQAEFSRRFQAGVQAAPPIRAVAAQALLALRRLAGHSFDCIHMRRRDFLADHAGEEATVEEYAERAARQLRAQGSSSEQLPVYLASDVAENPSTQAAFRKHFPRVVTLLQVFPESELDTFASVPLSSMTSEERTAAVAREMRFGNVDQLVCSRADHFVGNKWSSFTHHVCYLRELVVPRSCRDADIYGRSIDPQMEYT